MNRFRPWINTGCNAIYQALAQGVTPLARYASLAMLARVLTAHEMDRCALYLASSLVLGNLCDLGINVACIKFSAAAAGRPQTQRRLLAARLALALLVAMAAVLLAGPVAARLLHRPGDAGVLRLAAGSAALGAVASFTLALLQSDRKFPRIAAIAGVSAIMQLTPIALVISGRIGGLVVLVVADLLGKMVMIGANSVILARVVSAPASTEVTPWTEIFGFTRWISLSMAVGAVSNYIPTLALARSGTETSLAAYLLGAGLAGWIGLPVQAISSVLLPEAMEARDREKRAAYLKTWLPATCAVALIGAPLLWILAPWMTLIVGHRYAAAIGVFRILAIGQFFLLVVNPTQFLLYSMDRPALCFAGDVLIAAMFGILALLPATRPESVALSLLAAQTAGKAIMFATTIHLSLARALPKLPSVATIYGVAE